MQKTTACALIVLLVVATSPLRSTDQADIQTCEPPEDGFIGAIEFQCEDVPEYTVNSRNHVLGQARFQHGYWSLDLEDANPLTFETAGNCPILVQNLECSTVNIYLGSSFGQLDGSRFNLNGGQWFGVVEWDCFHSGDDTYTFSFPVITVDSDEESDIDDTMAEFLKNTFRSTGAFSDGRENINIQSLLKFDQITSKTETHYTLDTVTSGGPFNRFLFVSDDVAFKLSNNRYTTMISSGPPSNNVIGPYDASHQRDCANSYRLLYPEVTTTMSTTAGMEETTAGMEETTAGIEETTAGMEATTAKSGLAQKSPVAPMLCALVVWTMIQTSSGHRD